MFFSPLFGGVGGERRVCDATATAYTHTHTRVLHTPYIGNELEGAAYAARATVKRDDHADVAVPEADADAVTEASSEALDWLRDHPEASTLEIEAKIQAFERVVHPVIERLYAGQSAQSAPGEAQQSTSTTSGQDFFDGDKKR